MAKNYIFPNYPLSSGAFSSPPLPPFPGNSLLTFFLQQQKKPQGYDFFSSSLAAPGLLLVIVVLVLCFRTALEFQAKEMSNTPFPLCLPPFSPRQRPQEAREEEKKSRKNQEEQVLKELSQLKVRSIPFFTASPALIR